MLRTEDDLLTSLLGGSEGGVDVGNMGVVDPACEKVMEPFDCDRAAESGRGLEGWLESCEEKVDSLRSQFVGVPNDGHADASLVCSPAPPRS